MEDFNSILTRFSVNFHDVFSNFQHVFFGHFWVTSPEFRPLGTGGLVERISAWSPCLTGPTGFDRIWHTSRHEDTVYQHWQPTRRSTNMPMHAIGKAVSETTNRWIESVNRERESVETLLFFGIHYRISLSTITFEFRTISVSVSPLIFLQR